jgi:hypothetical protein
MAPASAAQGPVNREVAADIAANHEPAYTPVEATLRVPLDTISQPVCHRARPQRVPRLKSQHSPGPTGSARYNSAVSP